MVVQFPWCVHVCVCGCNIVSLKTEHIQLWPMKFPNESQESIHTSTAAPYSIDIMLTRMDQVVVLTSALAIQRLTSE